MPNKVKPTIVKEKEEQKEQMAQIVIPCTPVDKKFRICEVCGHSNPHYIAVCEMCSNYLILGEGD